MTDRRARGKLQSNMLRARVLLVSLAFAVVSCGARTGLGIPDPIDAAVLDTFDSAPVGCTPGTIALERARPAVMFVLDRSGSMGQRLGSTVGESRWQVLTRALGASLPSVDSTMQIGALLFPTIGARDTCAVATAADLPLATGNVEPLLSRMRSTTPNGSTPTASAMDAAASVLLAERAATSARALVLATDGAPDCNATLDGATCTCVSARTGCRGRPTQCLDDKRTVATIASLLTKGLPTYVIGLDIGGDGSFPDVLDAMADAGGRPKKDGVHRFYGASSEAELDAALVAIRDQVGACTYLTTSVPDDAGTITVTIDGVPVRFDPTGADGWTWASKTNGEIVFVGSACTRAAASADTKITARIECSDAG